jgi:hypothetical protein
MIKSGIYKHYKGNLYKVLGVARHRETLEEMIVYQALYGDYVLWVRPATMFLDNVEYIGKLVPRFHCITEEITTPHFIPGDSNEN